MTINAKYDFLKETYAEAIINTLLRLDRGECAGVFISMGYEDAAQHIDDLRKSFYKDDLEFADYPDDLKQPAKDAIFEAFAQMLDPTHHRKSGKSYKYLHWICPAFLEYRHNGKPMLVDDFYKQHDSLRDFDAWSARLKNDGHPNQIDDAALSDNKFNALGQILRPYQRQRARKQELRKRRYQMTPEQRQHIDDTTTVFYDGPEGRLLMAHSWESSKFWGSETKWCIAYEKTKEYFDLYHNKSPIFIYLPHANASDFRAFEDYHAFKFAAVDGHVWDELDSTRAYTFPDCMKKLTNAVIDRYQNHQEMLEYLIQHGQVALITDHVYQAPAMVAAQKDKPLHASNDSFHSITPDVFERPSIMIRGNAKKMLKIVTNSVSEFKHAARNLRSDPHFILKCMEGAVDKFGPSIDIGRSISYHIIPHIKKKSLLSDPKFASKALQICGNAIHDFPTKIRHNDDMILKAVATHPHAIVLWRPSEGATNFKPNHPEFKSFLEKAMMVNALVHAETEVFVINKLPLPDSDVMLAIFTKDPRSVLPFAQWVVDYDVRTQDDPDRVARGKDLIIAALEHTVKAPHEDPSPERFLSHLTSFCDTLSQYISHDPEVAFAAAKSSVFDTLKKYKSAAYREHIAVEALKHEPNSIIHAPHLPPEAWRALFAHYCDNDKQADTRPYLRRCPLLWGHAEALISLEKAYEISQNACQSDYPWPDVSAEIKNFPASRIYPKMRGMKRHL